MSKSLVVYFSKTGEQYGVGDISEGNTAILAKIIADKTGSNIFEIKVMNDNYPNTYSSLVECAKKEKQENTRPQIQGKIDNFDDYETIFLGYPNWWGDMPMPVYTFLESYNLAGKKVYHFCTHEGSGAVKRGDFAMYGHIPQNDKAQAEKLADEWLKGIEF